MTEFGLRNKVLNVRPGTRTEVTRESQSRGDPCDRIVPVAVEPEPDRIRSQNPTRTADSSKKPVSWIVGF